MLSQLQDLFLLLSALELGSQGRETQWKGEPGLIVLRGFCVLHGPCGPGSTSGSQVTFTLKGCSQRIMVHLLVRNVCCSLELRAVNPGVIPATLTTVAVVRTENRGVWSLPARLKGLWMVVSFSPDSATSMVRWGIRSQSLDWVSPTVLQRC